MTRIDDIKELEELLKKNPELKVINEAKGSKSLPANPVPLESNPSASRHKYNAIRISEADLLDQVIEVAHLNHWLVAHFRPARTEKGWRTAVSADGKGFPDLVLSRGKDLLFVELKSNEGKLSQEQQEWLKALNQNLTVECHIWRPDDWDKIVDRLI